MTFSDDKAVRTIVIRYVVVNTLSAYNLLLGRPSLNRLRAIASTKHMKMKLPLLDGDVIIIKSDQKAARKCYESSLKNRRRTYSATAIQGGRTVEVLETEIVDRRRPGPAGDVQEKEIGGKMFKMGASVNTTLQDKIAEVIAKHMDAFAWSSADMPGIDPEFLCRRLTVDESVRPVVHRRRKFNEEKRLIIRTKTQKLLGVNHIREVQYPEWLANVIFVHKANGKWRMCVDFTYWNKAYPKDSYPLPSIDSLVDTASGCRLLSFLDTFWKYNQIRMHPVMKTRPPL